MTSLVQLALLIVTGIAFGLAIAARAGAQTAWVRAGHSVFVNVALCSAVAAILTYTLVPTNGPSRVQLLLLIDIVEALKPSVDEGFLLVTIANVILFVPFGAALELRAFPLPKTALSGLALSAGVEGAQLLFVSGRTTSVDDLLFNTLGAALGHVALSRWAPPRGSTDKTVARRV